METSFCKFRMRLKRSIARSSSSDWLMSILGSIVEPAASVLFVGVANDFHCSALRSQFVVHYAMWVAVYRFAEKFQRRFAVAALG
jgi:hypothetical protein